MSTIAQHGSTETVAIVAPSDTSNTALETYNIKYNGRRHIQGAIVTDPVTKKTLYEVEVPSNKSPLIHLKAVDTNTVLASSDPIPLGDTSAIATTPRSQNLGLRHESAGPGMPYSYTSAALAGGKMTWTYDHTPWETSLSELVLRDAAAVPIARWTQSLSEALFGKGLGKLEFLSQKATTSGAKEEVLITGLTILHLRKPTTAMFSMAAENKVRRQAKIEAKKAAKV